MNDIIFLELPVKFAFESKEAKKLAELGINIDVEDTLEDGLIYVNPIQIESFNRDSMGDVNLGIGGEGFKIQMKFEDFIKIPILKILTFKKKNLGVDFDIDK